MKICITILFILLTSFGFAQVLELTVYLDSSGITQDIKDADRIISINQITDNTFIQSEQSFLDETKESYFKQRATEIRTHYNDSVYYTRNIYESCCNKKNYYSSNEKTIIGLKKKEYFEITVKNKEGFTIRKGNSIYLAPIIWDGEVKYFNQIGELQMIKTFSQGNSIKTIYFDQYRKELKDIKTKVDSLPRPIGSEKDFNTFITHFLARNHTYPKEAKREWQMPSVFVSFIITTKGLIECVHLIREEELFEFEIIKLISSLPGFKPATVNGKPVNFRKIIPIKHFID